MAAVGSLSFVEFFNAVDGGLRGSPNNYHGINPSTKETLWDVPVATEKDVEDAISSAKRAFPAWRDTPVEQRKSLIKKFKETFTAYMNDLEQLLSKEGGKPKAVASMELHVALDFFDHHLGIEIEDESLEKAGNLITTRFVPLGSVAAICPWNFPIVLGLGKILPALLTGNCVIVKPSPFTPYTLLKLVEMAHEAFPRGVLQVLGGDERLGPVLVAHPDIQKVSFTGSVSTGKKIMAEAAKTLKRVTLELGGNDPAIVLPDVDVDQVAPLVVKGAFLNSGQMCVAAKRVYIHDSIYDRFRLAMVKSLRSLVVGNASDEATTLGPLQNEMQLKIVRRLLEDTASNGYTSESGMSPTNAAAGYFLPPTLIDNPTDESRVVAEEQFGPILPTLRWNDENEVITRANKGYTGLGATVWSADQARAQQIARKLEVGSVWINSFEMPVAHAFFSGHKESGIGGEWGSEGWKAYCNVQAIHTPMVDS